MFTNSDHSRPDCAANRHPAHGPCVGAGWKPVFHRKPVCKHALVDRRRVDHAEAQPDEADDDGERGVLVFDQLFPEVIRRQLVHRDGGETEVDDADDGVEDGG